MIWKRSFDEPVAFPIPEDAAATELRTIFHCSAPLIQDLRMGNVVISICAAYGMNFDQVMDTCENGWNPQGESQ